MLRRAAPIVLLLLAGCMAELGPATPTDGAESKDPSKRVVPGEASGAALRAGDIEPVVLDIRGVGPSEHVVRTVHRAGATFLRLEFSTLELGDGDELEVLDGEGAVHETLFRRSRGPTWATRIDGEKIVLRLRTSAALGERRLSSTRLMVGTVPVAGTPSQPQELRSVCGDDDKLAAACFSGGMYQASQAVGHILFSKGNGSFFCSGVIISENNHFLTNHHCIATQEEADTAEFRFRYEATNCAGAGMENVTLVRGATLIKTSSALDYTLLQLPENVAAVHGWVGIAPQDVALGTEIYVPQHAGGRRKEIAAEDSQTNGPCTISQTNMNVGGYAWGANLGYTCDTEQGSSGAPILLAATHELVALHHLGGCNNVGVYMRNIVPEIQNFLGQAPPESLPPMDGTAPVVGWFLGTATDMPMPIPDADSGGVRSTIRVPKNLVVERVSVTLDVSHPFRGDLVATLRTPSGRSVVLSDRSGGSSDDLVGTFDLTGKVPGGLYTSGDWVLEVRDESKTDTGGLRAWSLQINDELRGEGVFDQTRIVNAPVPDNSPVGLATAIVVPTGVVADSVQVELSVAHTWRGDLEIVLESPLGTHVLVWPRQDPSDATDDVIGTFSLVGLDGDAGGQWVLRVRDLAPQDTGQVHSVRLIINGGTQVD